MKQSVGHPDGRRVEGKWHLVGDTGGVHFGLDESRNLEQRAVAGDLKRAN